LVVLPLARATKNKNKVCYSLHISLLHSLLSKYVSLLLAVV